MRIFDAIAAEPGPFFIVGSNKNAGKTTLFNHLNAMLQKRLATPPALATIGRDGEAEDAIWRHPKPPVHLFPDNLFVTVASECERLGNQAEKLEDLPFATALGRVVIGRALAATQVEMIGPDTNEELWRALERLRQLGAAHQLIDGAYERRTQVAMHDDARLALVVSADVDQDLARIADWLAFQVELYGLPSAPDELRPTGDLELGFHFVDRNGEECEPKKAKSICCIGPLTDAMLEEKADQLRLVPLVVEDATKLFVAQGRWRRLLRKSPGVFVLRTLRLVLIGANPNGLLRRFTAGEFFETLQKAAPQLPLIDVEAGLRHQPPAG